VDHLKPAKASSMKSHELTNEAKTSLTHILFRPETPQTSPKPTKFSLREA